MSDLVLQPKGSHRKIAQTFWGLTNEQMVGMHVHHRIPRSKGGTNDPSNLYVCSPWFHTYVWHSEDSYHPLVGWAGDGGRIGAQVTRQKWLEGEFKTGFETSSSDLQRERGLKGGAVCRDQKIGVCSEGYGEEVSKNMGSLVKEGKHWFQTSEHSERTRRRNQEQYYCDICNKPVKGLGPLALHRRVHFK